MTANGFLPVCHAHPTVLFFLKEHLMSSTTFLLAQLSRRRALQSTALAILGTTLSSWGQAQTHQRTLRFGHQKGIITLLKRRGLLERALAPLGVQLTWAEFNAGPVQLEALNAGSIDFASDVGDAPPIFAQAAGVPLAYVACTPPSPQTEALIVKKDSPIRSVADVKGKRLAFNKGSNVHYFLVQLLQKHGLAYSDVQPVFLPPADARAAFERGAVDAWLIWDPFLSAVELSLPTRQIADASGVVSNRLYCLSNLTYARENADVVAVVLEQINVLAQWVRNHPQDAAREFAGALGLPLPVVQRYLPRAHFDALPITPQELAEQQSVADTFLDLKLIPRAIDVHAAAV